MNTINIAICIYSQLSLLFTVLHSDEPAYFFLHSSCDTYTLYYTFCSLTNIRKKQNLKHQVYFYNSVWSNFEINHFPLV